MARKMDERSDLQRVFAQLHVVEDRLLSGELSPLGLRPLLQRVIDGELPEPGPFDSHLYGLKGQLAKLRTFNDILWDKCLAKEQLDAVDVRSKHTQRLDDLELLYVDFGSPMRNMTMWWKVISAFQQNTAQTPILASLLVNEAATTYEPGIHRVRINLMAYKGYTVESARAHAQMSGDNVAQAEVLAAVAYFPTLLELCDGKKLPFWWIPGWDAAPPLSRKGGKRVLGLQHDLVSRHVALSAAAGPWHEPRGYANPVMYARRKQ